MIDIFSENPRDGISDLDDLDQFTRIELMADALSKAAVVIGLTVDLRLTETEREAITFFARDSLCMTANIQGETALEYMIGKADLGVNKEPGSIKADTLALIIREVAAIEAKDQGSGTFALIKAFREVRKGMVVS